jgi:hypothetical protein
MVAGLGGKAQAAVDPTKLLSAIVTINGTVYEYKEEQGQDLGDFVSTIGGFTQRCVRCDMAGSPLAVFFRPDRTSDRVEVVFELGRMFGPVAAAANLGVYTVQILRGGQVLDTVTASTHYWMSRWRWQSAPRPVVADVDALMAQNLLPPYSAPTSSLSTPPPIPYTAYTIMGLAGITPYMPQTGERMDLGLLTEPQAQYVCTRNPAGLAIMRAQGEAAGTMPWHMRDENTNAPISFQKYPKACWFQDQKLGTPFIPVTKTPITIDCAHQPALAYVPYLLTGDPYFLEELQFQATWNYGSCSLGYRPTLSQTRQFAWNMRTLGQCTRITPSTVPSWLLPQSYWSWLMGVHRMFFEANYVNNPSPDKSLFRATDNLNGRGQDGKFPALTWCEPWQSDFLATVLGWLVCMGLTEWRTAFDWVIGGVLARTSSTSGWPRAQASPYEMMLRADGKSPIAGSWAQAWSLNASIAGQTYVNSETWAVTDMTYLTYARGALVYADKLGALSGDNLAWATAQLNTRKWKTQHKWRLGANLL